MQKSTIKRSPKFFYKGASGSGGGGGGGDADAATADGDASTSDGEPALNQEDLSGLDATISASDIQQLEAEIFDSSFSGEFEASAYPRAELILAAAASGNQGIINQGRALELINYRRTEANSQKVDPLVHRVIDRAMPTVLRGMTFQGARATLDSIGLNRRTTASNASADTRATNRMLNMARSQAIKVVRSEAAAGNAQAQTLSNRINRSLRN